MREKKLRQTEIISETIRELAIPGMKPKALIDAVKARHADAEGERKGMSVSWLPPGGPPGVSVGARSRGPTA